MFFLDLLILSGICAVAYGCFRAGAAFGTLRKAGAALLNVFKCEPKDGAE